MPRIQVLFGEQIQETKILSADETVIGRARECPVIIDNLGVSRRHCRILKAAEGWVVEDLGSQNGTFVNGERIARKTLAHGDRIGVGKHTIRFEEKWEGMDEPQAQFPEGLRKSKAFLGDVEHTMAVDTFRTKKFHAPPLAVPAAAAPAGVGKRCYLWDSSTGKTYDLRKSETTIGRGKNADVPISGWFVAPWHATIRKSGEDYYVNHLAGWRAVRVNGRRIRDARLENRDVIEIGRNSLQFFLTDAEPAAGA